MSSKNKKNINVSIISLGCVKNQIDSEIILGILTKNGFQIVNEPKNSDVAIINTCCFIESATQESIDTILEIANIKNASNKPLLVVAGCLPQRYKDKITELLPEVDLFCGIDSIPNIAELVLKIIKLNEKLPQRQRPNLRQKLHTLTSICPNPHFLPSYKTPRLRLGHASVAYVKIADGCNNCCSYCAIPMIRGRFRSRPVTDIYKEVLVLLQAGVKEINLVSQDSTLYGTDLKSSRTNSKRQNLYNNSSLLDLLYELDSISGNFWIRVLYTHPAHWKTELIDLIASSKHIIPYFDIPIQHIHPEILARMNRPYTPDQVENLIENIRSKIDNPTLRTTIITGFPGETEAHFQFLLEFIHKIKFDWLGVFEYSKEENTVAAKLKNHIAYKEKLVRKKIIMEAQKKITLQKLNAQIGNITQALVEYEITPKPSFLKKINNLNHNSQLKWFIARTKREAPEVDGRIFVNGHFTAGEFENIKIVSALNYDLIATKA